MGGDDLDDDDDAQWIQPVRGTAGDDSAENDTEDVHDDSSPTETKKRSLAEASTHASIKQPKLDPSVSHARLLVQAGLNIQEQDATRCAAFLTTCIQHYTQMQGSGGDTAQPNLDALARYCLGKSTSATSLLDRIRELVSIKKLKQWKMIASPCVVIVCGSARRAVAILKQLAPLKVRSAKLFPKNGSVQEQHDQLGTAPVAVGTPHRLCQLANVLMTKNGLLDHCQLLLFDCHASKQYTVCTLPDTAPECAKLVRDHVMPTWAPVGATPTERRKAEASGCRIAYV